MGRTQNRILRTLRRRRLALRLAAADVLDELGRSLGRDEPTPCLVPVRVERTRP